MLKKIEKIKRDVHQPLKWNDYNSTNVRNNTNAFSHAIGSTVASASQYYRLGMLSDKKALKEEYKSIEEVKDLFLADMSALDLKVERILGTETKFSLVESIQNTELENNQHIVVLFVSVFEGKESGRIKDFHFIRYDEENGWSEKMFRENVHIFQDILAEWPSVCKRKMVAVYKVTR